MSDASQPKTEPPPRERLTTDDVAKVAELALLDLTNDELATFTKQLDDVLDLAADLNGFDVADVPPTAHPYGLVNVFRADEPLDQTTSDELRTEALAAGPDVEADQFKVPPALGESP